MAAARQQSRDIRSELTTGRFVRILSCGSLSLANSKPPPVLLVSLSPCPPASSSPASHKVVSFKATRCSSPSSLPAPILNAPHAHDHGCMCRTRLGMQPSYCSLPQTSHHLPLGFGPFNVVFVLLLRRIQSASFISFLSLLTRSHRSLISFFGPKHGHQRGRQALPISAMRKGVYSACAGYVLVKFSDLYMTQTCPDNGPRRHSPFIGQT